MGVDIVKICCVFVIEYRCMDFPAGWLPSRRRNRRRGRSGQFSQVYWLGGVGAVDVCGIGDGHTLGAWQQA